MTEGFIHISRSTADLPSITEGVKGHEEHNLDYGYGLAGGGFGCYVYCNTCEQIVGKDLDKEEN